MLSSRHLGESVSTYKPTAVPTTAVSFKPVKNPVGNMNYVAFADPDTSDLGISISDYVNKYSSSNPFLSPGHDDDEDQDKKKERNLFSLDGDGINTFYIGSITVIGLFILYRIVSKSP
jgi:hypothetical protein